MQAFFTVFIVVVTSEMLVYFFAPQVYSYFARFPLGPTRRLVLHPRAREALHGTTTAGYRESAVGKIDLTRLELPPRLDTDSLVLHFDLARGFATARFPYSLASRLYGLVRVDVIDAHDALVLRPRFVLMAWPTMMLLAPFGVAGVVATRPLGDWTPTFLTGALFIGINVVIGLLFARTRLEAGVYEIERHIQAAIVAIENQP